MRSKKTLMYGFVNTQMYGCAGWRGLEKTDWLDFALAELAEKGHDALKAQTLAAGLGVTRGSFYWHFEDLEAFKRDLIGHWTDRTTGELLTPWCARGEAEAQLIGLMSRAFRSGASMERAVRSWATADAYVAASSPLSTGAGSDLPNNCWKRWVWRRRRSGLARACSTGPRSAG
jgi:AcrR family transcriptional regulator